VYLLKSSWVNIVIFFTKIAFHLWIYKRLSTTKFIFVNWWCVKSHVFSLASWISCSTCNSTWQHW
jgi:hypothetical protein